MIDWESESLVDDHAGRSPGPAARALIEKQRTVLEWYEHRSRGHGRDDAWPEGAVVVIEGGFAPGLRQVCWVATCGSCRGSAVDVGCEDRRVLAPETGRA